MKGGHIQTLEGGTLYISKCVSICRATLSLVTQHTLLWVSIKVCRLWLCGAILHIRLRRNFTLYGNFVWCLVVIHLWGVEKGVPDFFLIILLHVFICLLCILDYYCKRIIFILKLFIPFIFHKYVFSAPTKGVNMIINKRVLI